MFPKRLILIAVAFGSFAQAAHFDDKIRGDFFAGFAGDKPSMERALAASEAAIAENPKGAAEAMAWHGGGLMILAGEKFRQGDYAAGGDLWSKAVAEMDKAGELEPDNPAILIPRAAVWFAASRRSPPDMGKPLLEKAIADYEHVYQMQTAYFDKLDIHMRSELLFGLADGYSRNGNPEKARLFFEKLVAVGSAGGHFEQAKLYLKGEKYTVEGAGCVGCHTGASLTAAVPTTGAK
jgi:tetratricopeptide (TPR) repeat protein